MRNIRTFNFKVTTQLSGENYEKLRRSKLIPNLETLHCLQSRMAFLSGIMPVNYHCCPNSCICYTGDYQHLDACPRCLEARYNSEGQPRHIFQYIPLIPRLSNLFLNPESIQMMRYRSSYDMHTPGVGDVFDGEHYRELLTRHVQVGDEQLSHHFFDQPTDIALGLSTDGVGPFKSRKKTCWPLLVYNLNLPPELRFHLSHILCLGVIPGPNQPWDLDSFMFPFFDELKKLMHGVPTFNREVLHSFVLRAFLLYVFGDMQAIAKLMQMKGVNGFSPCRMCHIHGVAPSGRSFPLYTPLFRPGGASYDPTNIPLRSHSEFMHQAQAISSASTPAQSSQLSRESGINGIPLLATLSSISIPDSFPFDFMHLVSNIITTLVAHWTGTFKELGGGDELYFISPEDWTAIGAACKSSGNTIPYAFGSRVPDIAKEQWQFKTENWFTFLTFLGPALLHGRLAAPYYKHFLKFVNIFNLALHYVLYDKDIQDLEEGCINWVKDYEK